MKRLLLLVFLLVGCGPTFSPTFFTQCEDMMLPPTQGLHGPNPPVVGGAENSEGQKRWNGKIVLVSTPETPAQKCRLHPANAALAKELRAVGEGEVGAVGFVQQRVQLNRGAAGGSGALVLTVVDWKSKVNLGTWIIKEWTMPPEEKDFQAAYPDLAGKVLELH